MLASCLGRLRKGSPLERVTVVSRPVLIAQLRILCDGAIGLDAI